MWRLVVGILSIISCQLSYASVIEARLKNDNLQWLSAQVQRGQLTPSLWEISQSLPAADSFIPSAPVNANIATNVIFTSKSGTSVTIPIKLSGMEYILSENPRIDMTSPNVTVTKNRVLVLGSGITSAQLSFSTAMAPFIQYRPLIEPLSQSELNRIFNAVGYTKADYTGTLNITVPYDFIRDGIRIRNIITFPLLIKIHYDPATITDVSIISGDGNMETSYHGYPNMVVNGETEYHVRVKGVFADGLLVGLKPKSDQYYMTETGTSLGREPAKIKYNVTCTFGCQTDRSAFIIDGVPQIDNSSNRSEITSVINSGKQADLRLRVYFNNQRLSEINTGDYRGRFTLVFSVKV